MKLARILLRGFLGRRLPRLEGRLAVPGIAAAVRIVRDEYGIPHIYAECDADAWFGLGFVHAQDRAFQLEALLRTARGTLAELAGRSAVPIDRLSRRVGFRRAAEKQLAVQPDDVAGALGAYARGINAGLARGLRRRPHEFVFLGGRPSGWEAVDVVAVLALLSFLLPSNWDSELVRLRVLRLDGGEALEAVDTRPRSGHAATWPPGSRWAENADRLREDLARARAWTGISGGGGSNNWVVAPARTRSGRPLLANDPHLAPVLPSPWYLAHLETPEWLLAGAGFVGLPGISAGHNGFAAWGVTAGLADNTDFFIEEIGPDGESVRDGDAFVPCRVLEERIRVRRGRDVVERILLTPRGPVVSPAFEGESCALSLKATWLEPRAGGGMLRLGRVRSFEEFRAAFASWPAPPLNLVYADAEGRIGWQFAGDVPRRKLGNGLFPMPGWKAGSGWDPQPLPFEALPWAVDPDCGYIATANNRPLASANGTAYLGDDFLPSYRARRIQEALAARADWDLESTLALQLDVRSLLWPEIRERVLSAAASRPGLTAVHEVLRDWNGEVREDSAGAAVFELFLAEIARRIAEVKAPRAKEYVLGRGFTPLEPRTLWMARWGELGVRSIRAAVPGFLPEPWPEEIARALERTLWNLEAALGFGPSDWRWGAIHKILLTHALGGIPVIGRAFNRGPFPLGGDADTVAQAAWDPVALDGLAHFTVSLRAVIECGRWDEARFVLPGGQSGNPLSPHYDDQLPLWLRGGAVRLAVSREAVERAARAELVLEPA